MTRYSHSRLTAFEQCPRKYAYQYIEKPKIDRPESIEAFMGSAAHDALEWLYGQVMKTRLPSREELAARFHKVWDEKWNGNIVIMKKEFSAADYRRLGERCVTDYYDNHHPFDRDGRVLGLEQRVEFSLDEDGRYQMQGFIDRLAEKGRGELEIHDYKTNGRLPEPGYLEKDRQLALYRLAVAKLFPDARSIELIWHFLQFGREIRVNPTEEHLQDTRDWAISTIRQIEREESFAPQETYLCDWCEFKSLCPAKNPAPEPLPPPSQEQAAGEGADLVKKLAALREQKKAAEQGLKETEKRLLELAQKSGLMRFRAGDSSVEVEHKIWREAPRKDSAEREPLEAWLRGQGLWEAYSTLDGAALMKALKGGVFDDARQAELERLLEERDEWKMKLVSKP